VSTCSSGTAMPNRPSFAATSPTGTLELFDMKPTVHPAARSAVTASAAPAMGSSPRQITPSRSQHTTGGELSPAPMHPLPSGGVVGGARERVAILGLGPHGQRESQVGAGADAVARSQEAQAEAEVRVVVHRVE